MTLSATPLLPFADWGRKFSHFPVLPFVREDIVGINKLKKETSMTRIRLVVHWNRARSGRRRVDLTGTKDGDLKLRPR
jgi:hypothetical protein